MYYFASDMHLKYDVSTGAAQRERILIDWLDRVSKDAEAIFLLGDVFDFWFEFKRVIPKGFSRFLGKLSQLSDRGVELHLFVGNHDMWAFDYLQTECGVTLHRGYGVFNLYGKMVYVAHGDGMNPRAGVAERVMNWLFRSKFVQGAFATILHPDIAIRFGGWWSNSSRKSKSVNHRFLEEREPLVAVSRAFLERGVGIDYFVFGHTHCKKVYDLGGAKAIFLGEWFSDPCYGVLKPDGVFELKDVEQ